MCSFNVFEDATLKQGGLGKGGFQGVWDLGSYRRRCCAAFLGSQGHSIGGINKLGSGIPKHFRLGLILSHGWT